MSDPEGAEKNRFPLALAFALIVIGVLFLLRNFQFLSLSRRWWALFFLIPISYLLAGIRRSRKSNQGKYPAHATGSFIGTLGLATVMLVFLFGLHWNVIWPVFIIIGGVAIVLRGTHPQRINSLLIQFDRAKESDESM